MKLEERAMKVVWSFHGYNQSNFSPESVQRINFLKLCRQIILMGQELKRKKP